MNYLNYGELYELLRIKQEESGRGLEGRKRSGGVQEVGMRSGGVQEVGRRSGRGHEEVWGSSKGQEEMVEEFVVNFAINQLYSLIQLIL